MVVTLVTLLRSTLQTYITLLPQKYCGYIGYIAKQYAMS
jgi:hypothetical protein